MNVRRAFAIFALCAMASGFSPQSAYAATFTVSTTTDTSATDANAGDGTCATAAGDCTLRAAIQEANALAGTDTINFTISGSGVKTITLGTALPEITGATTIDGSTQTGSSCGDLWGGTAPSWNIVIDGDNSFARAIALSTTADGSTIQGLSILGFSAVAGINLASDSNTITCNSITQNEDGIIIGNSDNNVIGGDSAGEGNLISSNDGYGIRTIGATSDSNTIQGNFIGTDVAGTSDSGNGDNGIRLGDATNTQIGGTTAGMGNLIAGNNNTNLDVNSSSSSTTIQGNYIGTNITGTAAIGNTTAIAVNGASTTIGGTIAGAGNVISGASDSINSGISQGGTGTIIQGNYIGTNAAGTVAIPNVYGILATGGTATIGGTTAAARNIISGNTNGMLLLDNDSAVTGFVIQGNYIGVGTDGTTALGNTNYGILLVGDLVTNNTIGGTAMGAGNIIANSGDAGISTYDVMSAIFSSPPCTFGPAGAGNSILGNSIYSNGDLGIDFTEACDPNPVEGVTANDSNDADTGPNNYQNFPVLSSATTDGSTTSVAGTLNSVDPGTYRVEFFANPTADSSGNGEGKTYLGATTVTLSGSNDGSFTATDLTATTIGYTISATASKDLGSSNYSTSEFSAAVTVAAPATETVAAIARESIGGRCARGYSFDRYTRRCARTTPPLAIQVCKPNDLYNALTGARCTFDFLRNLSLGSIGEDVRALQKYLNTHGFPLTSIPSTPGAPGRETTLFGALTREALIKYQKARRIIPSMGYFGPITRAAVNGVVR